MFLVDDPGWALAAAGDEVRVSGGEGRHAVSVVRLRDGDPVLLGGRGRRAEAVVTHTERDAFTARLVAVRDEARHGPRFVLVQALAKGGRDEQAVETATELGVDEVVPWQSSRGVAVWRGDEREARGRQRWVAVAAAAAKQSRRPRVPDVAPPAGMREVVDRVAAAALALVLHEEASAPLAGVALPADGDVVLVVGPEGGITPAELGAFTAAGARAVRLGGEVLRTSSAGPAALAVLNAMGRWR
jgi:16S rRNA (uracil1498-N3)-methyltransferase